MGLVIHSPAIAGQVGHVDSCSCRALSVHDEVASHKPLLSTAGRGTGDDAGLVRGIQTVFGNEVVCDYHVDGSGMQVDAVSSTCSDFVPDDTQTVYNVGHVDGVLRRTMHPADRATTDFNAARFRFRNGDAVAALRPVHPATDDAGVHRAEANTVRL